MEYTFYLDILKTHFGVCCGEASASEAETDCLRSRNTFLSSVVEDILTDLIKGKFAERSVDEDSLGSIQFK